MNMKHIVAAISVATALAVITPAYAGGLGGGLGMNRGLSGQGAFQGQGAVGGSLDKPKLHPATNAVKQGSVTGDATAQSAGSVSKTGTAGAANLAGSTESTAAVSKAATSRATSSAAPSASTTVQKPAPSASPTGAGGLNATTNKGSVAANGMGSVDAEHSSSGTSLDVAGTASAAASRNP